MHNLLMTRFDIRIPPLLYMFILVVCYVLTASNIFRFWFHETQATPKVGNVVQLADGTAYRPFVGRRLYPDATRLLAAAVPSSFWESLSRQMHEGSGPLHDIRCYVDSRYSFTGNQKKVWEIKDYPIHITGYVLIWASIIGYLFVARSLVNTLYYGSQLTRDIVAGAVGVALLGGMTDCHYELFTYDFPNAFVFTLALTGLIRRRWWFFPAFLVAVYSKETALLLILGYVLLWRDRWSRSFGIGLIALGVSYFAIRSGIDRSYPPAPDNPVYWYPLRNLELIYITIKKYSWYFALVVLAIIRLCHLRSLYPWQLCRLIWLLGLVIPLAFFKGWFEELRQYYEVMAIPGLMVIQAFLNEIGLGDLLVSRDRQTSSSPSDQPSFLSRNDTVSAI